MVTRREFLKGMLAVTAGITMGGSFVNGFQQGTIEAAEMPRRPLGKTGEQVSIFGLGGEAVIEQEASRDQAREIINYALDAGVNYIDTAPSYGNGASESNIGSVMAERRQEVFLATKTHERGYDGTMRLFENSLNRLNTDYLDLYQLHTVRTEEDLQQIFADDGAIHALEELRDEGSVKNLGITGHYDPEVLLRGIQEYNFDCLLLSLNAGDIHYSPFQEELLEEAVEQDLGRIAMKVMARGRILGEGGLDSAKEALDYVWSLPVSTSIVGIDSLQQLQNNIEKARNFTSLSLEKMEELENKTAEIQDDANFFKYSW